MGPANRQDVQNIINIAQNRIMDRAATKQDMVTLTDTIRTLTALNQQTQQMLKQADYQRSQHTRRVVALEARLQNVENELKNTQVALGRYVEHKPQPIIMPVQSEQQVQAAAQQFAQNPNI